MKTNTPPRSLRAWTATLLAALATAACPSTVNTADGISEISSADLPATAEKCLTIGAKLGIEGAERRDLGRALAAFERAGSLAGETTDLLVKQAKTIFFYLEPLRPSDRPDGWLDKGDSVADRLIAGAVDRVEGHYYKATFMGFRAQAHQTKANAMIPEIVEEVRRGIEIDASYDDAAGLMFLGMILVKAPAWPHGVGDPEEGIETLRRGAKTSSYPLNRLILAKALFHLEQTVAGCRELIKVLSAPKRGRWARTGARYRKEAQILRRSYSCSNIGRRN